MTSNLVSILTPFKNTESFLSECINSIRKQTHEKWELILIDDHSIDESRSIAWEFSNDDRRVKFVSNKGSGIIDALRTGYSMCTGEYITRMDSDDIMSPNKLDHMVKLLEEKGRGHIATGIVNYFGESEISEGYREYENWLNELTRTGSNFDEIYKECSICSPCWMVNKSDFDLCGAFNSDEYPEDYDLTFRFYQNGLKVIPSNELLHLWRDYDSRTSKVDSHYSIDQFIKLKTRHFVGIDWKQEMNLCVLGAGDKGKLIADVLMEKEIPFSWVTNHPGKLGVEIHDKLLMSWEEYLQQKSTQSIITFSPQREQDKLKEVLEGRGQKQNQDFFFFC